MVPRGKDKYGRKLASIYANRDAEQSVNFQMVANGFARRFMLHPGDRNSYRRAEDKARLKKRGVWKYGEWEHPAQFRRRSGPTAPRRSRPRRRQRKPAGCFNIVAAALGILATAPALLAMLAGG